MASPELSASAVAQVRLHETLRKPDRCQPPDSIYLKLQALIREYLQNQGLFETAKCFEQEQVCTLAVCQAVIYSACAASSDVCASFIIIVIVAMQPRTSSSISNRHSLRKALGLNSYVARLKQQNPDQPLPPVLLLWVE